METCRILRETGIKSSYKPGIKVTVLKDRWRGWGAEVYPSSVSLTSAIDGGG